MFVLRLVLLISVVALTANCQQNSPAQAHTPPEQARTPPASCPVTVSAAVPFTPPAPFELDTNQGFWLGSDKLWTAIPKSGLVWGWRPQPPGYEHEIQSLTAKTFWGSVDFNWKEEHPPKLTVTGKRLDGEAPPLRTQRATNAFPGPAAAMLVGVYVPTPGCWEITGDYKGHKVSFVVWVTQFEHVKQP